MPDRDIRLLTGCRLRDIRREPVGGFAGAIGPDAPVGTFANTRRPRRQGRGNFASFPCPQRQGSFADTDLDVIVNYDHGAERSRVVGDAGLRRLLQEAALESAAGEHVVDELHVGHAMVLAEVAEIAPGDARARLEQVARAA
ncbi:MAG: hypothetical protein ACRDN8_18920 [Thermoleophilaceae bacterium]